MEDKRLKELINDFIIEFKKDKKLAMWIVAFVIFAMTSFELFNRPLIGEVRCLKIPFDDKIPFIKEFIIPYDTFLPAMILVGFCLFTYDKKEYKKYVITLFCAQAFSYVIFTFFQTYIPRYDMGMLGDDISSKLIKMTYTLDNPYAGAPSLHVCNMLISAFYFYKTKFSKTIRFSIILYLLFVGATTVFVKQHVFLDIPIGIVYAVIWYKLIEFYYERKKRWLN